VYELAKRDKRVIFIGSDIGAGTLEEFKQEMPERFFMEGVQEANIIGIATGLALNGKIPYINTIGVFLTRRCFEQILLDLCFHNAKVRLIGSGGGFVYAPLGYTHLALEDIAIMRAIPNMTIVAPADAEEMKRFMPQTLEYDGPIYIRLAKGGDPIVTSNCNGFEIGKPILMKEGSDALIVTTGVMLKNALDASDGLERRGVRVGVLHVHTLKPVDKEVIIESLKRIPVVVTIEEHTVIGGLGSIIAEIIAEANFDNPKRFKMIGIPDEFPDQYGSQASLMKRYSLTKENLVATIETLLNKGE
jgi:transketolase